MAENGFNPEGEPSLFCGDTTSIYNYKTTKLEDALYLINSTVGRNREVSFEEVYNENVATSPKERTSFFPASALVNDKNKKDNKNKKDAPSIIKTEEEKNEDKTLNNKNAHQMEITKKILRSYVINRFRQNHDLAVNVEPQRDYLREANLGLSLQEMYFYLYQFYAAKSKAIDEQISCYNRNFLNIALKSGMNSTETFDTSNFQLVMDKNGECRGVGVSLQGRSSTNALKNFQEGDIIKESKLENIRGQDSFSSTALSSPSIFQHLLHLENRTVLIR